MKSNGQLSELILTSIWITQVARTRTKLQRVSTFSHVAENNRVKGKSSDGFLFSPRSSLESSLGGLCRFRCDDKLEECELLLVLLFKLLMLSKLCCGGPPKCGRVRKGANIGMPNCKNGAHGRDLGARCAATAAS